MAAGQLPRPCKSLVLTIQYHGKPSKGRMDGVRRRPGKHLAHFRVLELPDALGWLRAVKIAQPPDELAQGRAAVPYASQR